MCSSVLHPRMQSSVLCMNDQCDDSCNRFVTTCIALLLLLLAIIRLIVKLYSLQHQCNPHLLENPSLFICNTFELLLLLLLMLLLYLLCPILFFFFLNNGEEEEEQPSESASISSIRVASASTMNNPSIRSLSLSTLLLLPPTASPPLIESLSVVLTLSLCYRYHRCYYEQQKQHPRLDEKESSLPLDSDS